MQVAITGRGNLELAIRSFRKKTQKEGIIKEARRRKAYEKPSEEKKRRIEENITRKKRSRKSEYHGS
jgi:small subunit ribosomal protein S21